MLRRTMLLWWAILTLLAAGFSTMATPTTASARTQACPLIYPRPAYCDGPAVERATAGVNHVGWVYLNLNYCPPARACAMIYHSSTSSWTWTGSTWRRSSLQNGWVYVYPYTGSWRWAWTQSSGWVAVNSGRFEIRGW